MRKKDTVRWAQPHKQEMGNQFNLYLEDNEDGISPYFEFSKKEDKEALEDIYHSFEEDHVFRKGVSVASFLRNYANAASHFRTEMAVSGKRWARE